jgi:hypothetical protein
MKSIKILLIAVLFMAAYSASAQWTTSGTNIYNSNTGFVGIGTAGTFTPTKTLHVYSAASSAVIRSGSSRATSGLISSLHLADERTGDIFNASLRTTGTTHEMIQSVYSSTKAAWLEYCYVNLVTGNYEMRAGILNAEFKNSGNILLNNTGAIGIGTGAVAIPAGVKLAVNGKVNCKEVEVTLSGWSDYVFNNDYQLKPLSEVEQFIKENKHLPDVPSEKEVINNGNNLGKMDAILLQKIEELTLYMIDLKKENDLLKDQIVKLQN